MSAGYLTIILTLIPVIASFLVYNRYDLYAYQWASQLDYETSKWNLTAAYAVFNDSVTAYGKPVLSVGDNETGWGIGYGSRYYDEGAETIDMYLTFWLLGDTRWVDAGSVLVELG